MASENQHQSAIIRDKRFNILHGTMTKCMEKISAYQQPSRIQGIIRHSTCLQSRWYYISVNNVTRLYAILKINNFRSISIYSLILNDPAEMTPSHNISKVFFVIISFILCKNLYILRWETIGTLHLYFKGWFWRLLDSTNITLNWVASPLNRPIDTALVGSGTAGTAETYI